MIQFEYLDIGLCSHCALWEAGQIRKYLKNSLIGGCVLVLAAALFLRILQTNVLEPVNAGNIYTDGVYNLYMLGNVKTSTRMIIYTICFLFPFGVGFRYPVEGYDKYSTAAIFMIEAIVAVFLAPLLVIYKIYRLQKLRKVLKAAGRL